MASSICMMIDGWMPSVGSSRTSSVGRVTSARAIASCWAWPPESSPAGRPIIVASAGKTSRASLIGVGVAAARALVDDVEVLAHRQAGEDLVALGHVADAPAGPLVRGRLR